MIRVRVPLEAFRALLLQDSGAARNEAGASREIQASAAGLVQSRSCLEKVRPCRGHIRSARGKLNLPWALGNFRDRRLPLGGA